MTAHETSDKQALRALFARDPIAAVYQLGDLAEPFFSACRWFASDSGAVLLYYGLAVPVLVTFGDTAALLPHVPVPPRFYTKLADAELPLFAAYRLTERLDLYVMGLDALIPATAAVTLRIATDAAPLIPLYRHYPGNYFEPSQVESGLYVVAEIDGCPVAAGGTHAYAPEERAAALGNLVTATEHRGRGIARALMGFLCAELLRRGICHIGLHVTRDNRAAIACYRKLGFSIHSEIAQYTAERA
jgi:ribosomal protein S18 acetylase RimI-like enzyme